MKVYVKGQPIDLNQRDFVAAGGEGQIFARGSIAYKVYLNTSKMLPGEKIRELSTITDPRVIKPEQVLTNAQGKPVGYSMRFVKDAWALCQLFPRVFRDRNGVTHDMMRELVGKLREGVQNVHKAGVLIVDLNEMNFLVGKAFDDIYFIDADSYQTPGYPATAIMPSIRDWQVHGNQFTENSDWFSFGVVSFQMFTGIHPYKGKHPSVQGMEERMKAGISVFNKSVAVPVVAYPWDVIPKPYRAWYEAVFEQGKRCPPPDAFGAVVMFIPTIRAVGGSARLDIEEIGSFDGNITHLWANDDHLIVVTGKGVWLDGHSVPVPLPPGPACLGFSSKGKPVLAYGGGAIPTLTDLTNPTLNKAIGLGIGMKEMTSSGGCIFLRMDDQVVMAVLADAGDKVIGSTKSVVQTVEHASRLYPGVVIQRLLGTPYVSLLMGHSQPQVHLKELENYRIVDAKYEREVLMVIGEKQGKYDRLVFRFDQYSPEVHDLRVVKDIRPSGLNFTVLDSGVCICLNEDENLELFSNKMGSQKVDIIDDPVLGGDMMLSRHRGLIFARGGKVYRMKMKGAKP